MDIFNFCAIFMDSSLVQFILTLFLPYARPWDYDKFEIFSRIRGNTVLVSATARRIGRLFHVFTEHVNVPTINT